MFIFMPGCTSSSRSPDRADHYKVGSVVTGPRASIGGLTANFGIVISVKGTPGLTSSWSTQILGIMWPCVVYMLVVISAGATVIA